MSLAALVAGLVAVLLGLPVGAARAGQTPGTTSDGYMVSVQVTFSGDGKPSGGGSFMIHPSCYWKPAPGDYTNMAAMLAWYLGVTGGGNTVGNVRDYGPVQAWRDAATAEAGGDKLAWYVVHCDDPADYVSYGTNSYEGNGGTLEGGVTFTNYLYKTFPIGTAPPAPRIDPEELAKFAYDRMVIQKPVIARNPNIGAAGGPTLVRLPTWFWVTNAPAVGGPEADGKIEITASVGDVWATVTASTDGLQLHSPAGDADCSPAAAKLQYHPGLSDSGACTVQFSRASTGGPYLVTASTQWNAVWAGSDGDGGDLAPLARGTTVPVPVAEVQNVVTR